MPTIEAIHSELAPAAIGTYSQAVRVGDAVYLSGQIPLDPNTGEMAGPDFEAAAGQAFDNLAAVAAAAGGVLNDAVKVSIFLTDLANFAVVNQVMARYFRAPYPARAVVGAAALPKGAAIEIEAILVLDERS